MVNTTRLNRASSFLPDGHSRNDKTRPAAFQALRDGHGCVRRDSGRNLFCGGHQDRVDHVNDPVARGDVGLDNLGIVYSNIGVTHFDV